MYELISSVLLPGLVILVGVFRVSRLFAELEMVLANSSAVDNFIDILSDVESLRSLGNYMLRASNSCKSLYLSPHCV